MQGADQGRLGALNKLIPGIDAATIKSKDSTKALEEAAALTNGAAADAAKTYGGQMKVMSNQIGEAEESIGAAFLPILNKLIPVLKIAELHPDEAVERELMLLTVKATPELRSQITELASIFQARIDDVGHDALTIQVAGAPEKLDAMTDLLQPFGIIELQRTGRIALPKLARRPAKLRAVKNRAV